MRCDNAGEHTSLREELINEGLGNIKIEFTAPRTPQKNGVVEREFSVLYGTVRTIFQESGIPQEMRINHWAEAVNTATYLNNLTVSSRGDETPQDQLNDDNNRPPLTFLNLEN